LWYEYPIPASPERQREIIRQLREWIENLESRGIIEGFAFDHYSGQANASDELRIRFDCTGEGNLKVLRVELEREVKRLIPDYIRNERIWDSGRTPEHILKAYELGSRCAFLLWKLIERGRFSENYLSNYATIENQRLTNVRSIPLEFQVHFNHGVMNSLGISKIPNEQWIHLVLLKESTRSASPVQLCQWIRRQPTIFFG